jgi:RNA recognition motif-containing protein
MGSRLYVGNLPFSVDENALRGILAEAGFEPTDVAVVKDRDTGRSRGFGFVTLASDAAAKAATQALNGKELEGRALTVNEARERTGGGGGGGGFGGGRGGGRRERW